MAAVVGLGGLLLLDAKTTKQVQAKNAGRSLKSVSNSETDVTVNLTRFAKVLVGRTTRKLSKYKWMDPSKDWGQNRGSRGAGKQESNGKTGNLDLQEGELPKFSLYCLLFRRQRPRVRETYRCQMAMKQQSNTKENLL